MIIGRYWRALAIPDEASERLEAFELVDGHYQYKEGITQSSTTCNPMPPAWPQTPCMY